VKVRQYRGNCYVDIREYWTNDGKQCPTKKGVALSIANWEEFKKMIPSIDEAIKQMKK